MIFTNQLESDRGIGIAEIAAITGFKSQAVCNWRRRHKDFPEPFDVTKATPIFLESVVMKWLTDNNKKKDKIANYVEIDELSHKQVEKFKKNQERRNKRHRKARESVNQMSLF